MQHAFSIYPSVSNLSHCPFIFSIYIDLLVPNEAPTCWYALDTYDSILRSVYYTIFRLLFISIAFGIFIPTLVRNMRCNLCRDTCPSRSISCTSYLIVLLIYPLVYMWQSEWPRGLKDIHNLGVIQCC